MITPYNVTILIDDSKPEQVNFKKVLENLISINQPFLLSPKYVLDNYDHENLFLRPTENETYGNLLDLAKLNKPIEFNAISMAPASEIEKLFIEMRNHFIDFAAIFSETFSSVDEFNNLIYHNTDFGKSSKEIQIQETQEEIKDEANASVPPTKELTVEVDIPTEPENKKPSEEKTEEASQKESRAEAVTDEDKKEEAVEASISESLEVKAKETIVSEEQAFADSVVSGVELANEEDDPSVIVDVSIEPENIVMNNGKPMDITTGEIVEEANIPTEGKTEEEKIEALAKEMMSKGSSAVISYGDPEEQPQEDVKTEVSASEPSTVPTQPTGQPVKDLSSVLTRMNSNLPSQEEVQTELDPTLDISGFEAPDFESEMGFDDSQLFNDTSPVIDDEIDMTAIENKKSDVPEGKLYSDKYEYLEVTYERYQESFNNNSILSGLLHRQKAEVGFDPKANDYLEKIWANHPHRDYISYKTHLANYPEMERIDLPKYWAESYIKLWDKVAPYDEPNEVISKGILTFDSFVRAKLNRDIPCEPMIKDKIDALYI